MPSVTIWVTDHFISQRVASALKTGFGDDALLGFATTVTTEQIAATPVHIGYGILRSMDKVARMAEEAGKDWFLLDLGYSNPGHFHGNYRIGYKGTQTLFDAGHLADASPIFCAPWKEGGHTALICPATDYVAGYFNLDDAAWCKQAEQLAADFNLPAKIRRKGDPQDLSDALNEAACVITFNSSVAWKALAAGIPAFSDIYHSTLGSWHGTAGQKSIDALKALSRDDLFRFMAAHELDLLAIQQGRIKNIVNRYIKAR